MYFKNSIIYRFEEIESIGIIDFESLLHMYRLQKCMDLQRNSIGWCNDMQNENYVISSGNQHLICFGSNDKLLPASVIKQQSAEQCAEIEVIQGYKPGRRQRNEIMEAVEDKLLASAFQVTKKTYVWLDFDSKFLIIDTSSIAKADSIIALLIKTFDGLKIQPIKFNVAQLTEIVSELPDNFELSDECTLYDAEQKDIRNVTLKRHELISELHHQLNDGKRISSVALVWRNRINFVINQKSQLKKIDFIGIKSESRNEQNECDVFFDEFCLMANELKQMIPDLLNTMGDI